MNKPAGVIVIVGGGCYGSYYVRQLHRARNAGAISWERLLVVDRDASCRVAVETREKSLQCEVIIRDWNDFFGEYLGELADDSANNVQDTIVPSPLMPHLLYEWLHDRACQRWPERQVCTIPMESNMSTPWFNAGAGHTGYASFATWTCPINCIEPRICPHTKGVRDWTMPDAASDYVAKHSSGLTGPLVFHCTHRAYGVGMIDTASVIKADSFIANTAREAPEDFLVGTVSHCHGAFNILRVGS